MQKYGKEDTKHNMEKEPNSRQNIIELNAQYMNCDIAVYCQQLDYGYEIRILGGHRSHIGSVTVADKQGTLQTITLPGHKEDVITRQWASQIWEIAKQPVSVLAGVHYDDLRKEQLMEVIQILDKLLSDCKTELQKRVSSLGV